MERSLDDKYQTLREEHVQLKKKSNAQEERIKHLTTKLMRYTSGLTKYEHNKPTSIEEQNKIDELEKKLYELEKKNQKLVHKIQIDELTRQREIQQKNPYSHVKSRTNTGQFKKKMQLIPQKESKKLVPLMKSSKNSISQPISEKSYIEENTDEEEEFEKEETVVEKNEPKLSQLSMNPTQIDIYLQNDANFDLRLVESHSIFEYILYLRSRINELGTNDTQKEDKLQLKTLETKLQSSEKAVTIQKNIVSELKNATEEMQKTINDLKSQNNSLSSQLKIAQTKEENKDADMLLEDLKKELRIVKEMNQKLRKQIESQSKTHQTELSEATNKADQAEKTFSETNIQLRSTLEEMQINSSRLQDEYIKLKSEQIANQIRIEDLQKQLKAKETEIEESKSNEIDSVLEMIRTSKRTNNDQEQSEETIERLSDEVHQAKGIIEMQKVQIANLESDNAKLRVEIIARKKEHSKDLTEKLQIIDKNSQTIAKLDSQVTNLLRGNTQTKTLVQASNDDNTKYNLKLDENVLVFTIHRLALSHEHFAEDVESCVSFGFFEFEQIATSPQSGLISFPQCSVSYQVTVNDSFLSYCKSIPVRVEVFRVAADSLYPIGECFVSFKWILSDKTFEGEINVVDKNTVVGSIQISYRMVRPISSEVRLFNIKESALLITEKTQRSSSKSIPSSNELNIVISSCTLSRSIQHPPNTFVYFTFFHFEAFTKTVKSSNNPSYEFSQSFLISSSQEFEEYLNQQNITFVVANANANDKDENDGECDILGTAQIKASLLLSQPNELLDMKISIKRNKKTIGELIVSLFWTSPYEHIKGNLNVENSLESENAFKVHTEENENENENENDNTNESESEKEFEIEIESSDVSDLSD